jgi:hypothetical protein
MLSACPLTTQSARETFLEDQAEARRTKVKESRERRVARVQQKKDDILATYEAESK